MKVKEITNRDLLVKTENCFHELVGYVLLRAKRILLVGSSLGAGSVDRYTSSLIFRLYSKMVKYVIYTLGSFYYMKDTPKDFILYLHNTSIIILYIFNMGGVINDVTIILNITLYIFCFRLFLNVPNNFLSVAKGVFCVHSSFFPLCAHSTKRFSFPEHISITGKYTNYNDYLSHYYSIFVSNNI